MALKSAFASGLLFTLWHVNPNMLLRGLIDAANLDPDSFPRILDACQEIKVCTSYQSLTCYVSRDCFSPIKVICIARCKIFYFSKASYSCFFFSYETRKSFAWYF